MLHSQNPPIPLRPHRSRAVAAAAIAAASLGPGCRSYAPMPLDLGAHRAEFLARTPASPDVRAFAASLRPPTESAPAFDPGDGISLAEAEAIALVYNADLRVDRLRAGVTRATADNAGLWQDPRLGVDVARIVDSTPDPWKVFSTIGLTIPVSGRLAIEKERAGLEHAAELARVAEAEWRTRISVRRAWAELQSHESNAAATREFVDLVAHVLTVVDKMESFGEIPRTEARLFHIERVTNAAALATFESRARRSRLDLLRLMGLAPDAAFGMQPSVIEPPPRESLESRELELQSPAMLIAIAEYQASEKDLELETRRQYPDLEISPGFGREDGDDQILLGVALPVPLVNRNRQAIAEAIARRDVARAAAEATLEGLIASIDAARVDLEAATAQRTYIETQVAPLAADQYADARRLAQLGEVNTLVLLESLTRQHEAKLSLIEARLAESLASIQLASLIGPEPHPGPIPDNGDPSQRSTP